MRTQGCSCLVHCTVDKESVLEQGSGNRGGFVYHYDLVEACSMATYTLRLKASSEELRELETEPFSIGDTSWTMVVKAVDTSLMTISLRSKNQRFLTITTSVGSLDHQNELDRPDVGKQFVVRPNAIQVLDKIDSSAIRSSTEQLPHQKSLTIKINVRVESSENEITSWVTTGCFGQYTWKLKKPAFACPAIIQTKRLIVNETEWKLEIYPHGKPSTDGGLSIDLVPCKRATHELKYGVTVTKDNKNVQTKSGKIAVADQTTLRRIPLASNFDGLADAMLRFEDEWLTVYICIAIQKPTVVVPKKKFPSVKNTTLNIELIKGKTMGNTLYENPCCDLKGQHSIKKLTICETASLKFLEQMVLRNVYPKPTSIWLCGKQDNKLVLIQRLDMLVHANLHARDFCNLSGKEIPPITFFIEDCPLERASSTPASSVGKAMPTKEEHKTDRCNSYPWDDSAFMGEQSCCCIKDPWNRSGAPAAMDTSPTNADFERLPNHQPGTREADLASPSKASTSSQLATVRQNSAFTSDRSEQITGRVEDALAVTQRSQELHSPFMEPLGDSPEMTTLFGFSFEKVNQLRAGDAFAERYIVESSETLQTKLQTVNARDKYAFDHNKVVLTFYASSDSYQATKRLVEKLSSEHIHKLLDAIDDMDGYPPCLVFERGQHTLAEWLIVSRPDSVKQKAALHEILKCLDHLHDKRIIHCKLNPSNISFFGHSWKLTRLDLAVLEGDTYHTSDMSMYAPPEVIVAKSKGQNEVTLETNADMWSFGLIAFEVMSGKKFYSNPSLESVMDCLCEKEKLPSVEGVPEKQARNLVQGLICIDPRRRWTAKRAIDHETFKSAEGISQFMRMALEETLLANLEMEITIEGQADADPLGPKRVKKALAFMDDYLEQPVFVLNTGKDYVIKISLKHAKRATLPFQRISNVRVRPSDGAELTLKTRQITPAANTSEIAVLSHFLPGAHSSSRLANVSPNFGSVEEKYVRLDLMLDLVPTANLAPILTLKGEVFCKMVANKQRIRAAANAFTVVWKKLPQPTRTAARIIGFAFKEFVPAAIA